MRYVRGALGTGWHLDTCVGGSPEPQQAYVSVREAVDK